MIRRPRSASYLTLMPDTAPSDERLRVLCVDDEEDIRVIIGMALTLDPRIDAEVVGDGARMLELAQKGGYDMFVLDVMMPSIDGYEVCRRLKASDATRHVPTVFLTAKTQKEDIDRARELGAIACLKKPFDPVTLATELRALLVASGEDEARVPRSA